MSNGEWLEYAIKTPPSFDVYEEIYKEYLSEEQIPKEVAPAISARDLFRRPKLPVTAYIPGFIYAGSLNLVAGEPKAGKSTLVWHLINTIAYGDKFLGEESRKANVLYVTEQNEVSFRQETANIPKFAENPSVYILLPENSPTGSWPQKITFWGDKLIATNSSILVIDTFGSFANLPPGGENDSACISERLMLLKQLYKYKPNLGIILVHHIRKPSVDPRFPAKEFADLRDARGSTAIVGGTDWCVMLSKDSKFSTTRNIHTEGRFGPEEYRAITLTENGYIETPIKNNIAIRRY